MYPGAGEDEEMKIWITYLLLINAVLAGDLLYLYYCGAWYDPIWFIEITEVFMLYILGLGSLVTAIYYWKRGER